MAQEEAFVNPEPRIRPFRVLPGGAQAVPTEWYAAAIIFAALGGLWAIRRNMGQEAGHVHVGASSALVFALYYLIVTAMLRVAAGALASRDQEKGIESPVTDAVSFFA